MEEIDRQRLYEASDAITAAANALSAEVGRYSGPHGTATPAPLDQDALARIHELKAQIDVAIREHAVALAAVRRNRASPPAGE
jgi:hypothetical protein